MPLVAAIASFTQGSTVNPVGVTPYSGISRKRAAFKEKVASAWVGAESLTRRIGTPPRTAYSCPFAQTRLPSLGSNLSWSRGHTTKSRMRGSMLDEGSGEGSVLCPASIPADYTGRCLTHGPGAVLG